MAGHDAAPSDSADPKGRPRGGTLRLSRAAIVEAARGLDPATMTMQAVADRLGVDRKALNYHVTDREGLLNLIATDVFDRTAAESFKAHFDEAASATSSDWMAACRTWAATVCDSVVTMGAAGSRLPLAGDNIRVLEPAELVLQRMLRAGFDVATAGRGLGLLTTLAIGVGRDKLAATRNGRHLQGSEFHGLLASDDSGKGFEALRSVALLGINDPDDLDTQLDFGVDVLLTGLSRTLMEPGVPSPPAPATS